MASLMSGLSFLFMYVYFVIPLAPGVYLFIKWRSYRDAAPPDPQLGIKVILYYFKVLAYHACLASLAAFFMALQKSSRTSSKMVPLGIFLSCCIIYVVHHVLIQKWTNTIEFPQTARIYTGFNLIIVGLVGMISFAFTTATLLDKGIKNIETPLSFFVVYAIAWVFQTILFCKRR